MKDVATKLECTAVIKSVFHRLKTEEKKVSIVFDEMYVTPAARFRGGHIIGYSEDNPSELARTLFAVLVKPMFGKAAFVCRLVPVHRLPVNFVHNIIKDVSEDVMAIKWRAGCHFAQ